MLRAADGHALVLLALLAPLLACRNTDDGAGSDVYRETLCYEREELWRDVLALEAQTTAVGAGSIATTTGPGGTGGAGGGGRGGAGGAGGAAGVGGAGGTPFGGGGAMTDRSTTAVGGPYGEGGAVPAGCPDAQQVRPFLELESGISESNDDTLAIEPSKDDGDSCCYRTIQTFGVTGRPVRVGDGVVVAAMRRDEGAASTRAVPSSVVAHWEVVARLEHASVASFALLSLELIAHGAPLELVADSQRASLDEVRHAETILAHLARLGGRVEIAEMAALAHSRLAPDVDALVAASVRDGCVGETFASFEAAEQAARCEDADLARELSAIAVDEASHAALGFRVVAWALRTGRTTPAHVARCFQEAIAALRASPSAPRDASLERHGILAGDTRDALVIDVCRRVEAIGARLFADCDVARAA